MLWECISGRGEPLKWKEETVENKMEVYRIWEAWFNWEAEHAEQVERFIEDAKPKKGGGMVDRIDKSQVLESGGMQVIQEVRQNACPMQRAKKEQWQVHQAVQERNPGPWEPAPYKLSREGQWQITEHDLKQGSDELQENYGGRHRPPFIRECWTSLMRRANT